ncbi:MAG: exodeoxyribonuclease VII small subunit [Oscillospiraceae bacterium]|nr:exodeoxyribonuclease VII small subunit [Oscillospiraceae bacterium]
MAEKEKMTYEQAMKRLEEIVQKLEKETLPLDESLKLFEEGTGLADFCNQVLDRAEQKITKIDSEKEAE